MASTTPQTTFLDTLGQMERGRLVDELTATFADIVRAALETGKAGALTLSIKVKPDTSAAEPRVDVITDYAAKVPRPDRRKSIFFADANGGLHRVQPSPTLPGFAEEDTPTTPARLGLAK
jgi:hypothetical protein